MAIGVAVSSIGSFRSVRNCITNVRSGVVSRTAGIFQKPGKSAIRDRTWAVATANSDLVVPMCNGESPVPTNAAEKPLRNGRSAQRRDCCRSTGKPRMPRSINRNARRKATESRHGLFPRYQTAGLAAAKCRGEVTIDLQFLLEGRTKAVPSQQCHLRPYARGPGRADSMIVAVNL